MPALPTATSHARSIIRRCLTWGVVLTALGYAVQTLLQTVVSTYFPVGTDLLIATFIGLPRVVGPVVLAVGIVGVGVQLGLAAYGVRPTLPGDDRRD